MTAGCSRCGVSGWDPELDDECPCVARAEYQDSAEEPRSLLTESEQAALAQRVRQILRAAGKRGSLHAADAIARAVAGGAMPSSGEQVAAYCHVDPAVAERVMAAITEGERLAAATSGEDDSATSDRAKTRYAVESLRARLALAERVIGAADALLGRWGELDTAARELLAHDVEEYDDARAEWGAGDAP